MIGLYWAGAIFGYLVVGLYTARLSYRKYVDNWKPRYSSFSYEYIKRLDRDPKRIFYPIVALLFWPSLLLVLAVVGLWKTTVMRETPGQKKVRLEQAAKDAERMYQNYLREIGHE